MNSSVLSGEVLLILQAWGNKKDRETEEHIKVTIFDTRGLKNPEVKCWNPELFTTSASRIQDSRWVWLRTTTRPLGGKLLGIPSTSQFTSLSRNWRRAWLGNFTTWKPLGAARHLQWVACDCYGRDADNDRPQHRHRHHHHHHHHHHHQNHHQNQNHHCCCCCCCHHCCRHLASNLSKVGVRAVQL